MLLMGIHNAQRNRFPLKTCPEKRGKLGMIHFWDSKKCVRYWKNKYEIWQIIVMILNVLLICAINQIPPKKIVYFFHYFDQIHFMLIAQYMNSENR